jgi:translation initiation factor 3 subunit B
MIDFSPCERYLVTCSFDRIVVPEGAERGSRYFSPQDEGNQIAVWDVKSGELIRTFPAMLASPPDGDAPSGTGGAGGGKKVVAWPQLKWSPDDRYVGRVTPGQQISIYELPGMGLEGRKSLKIEGVIDFEWCPIGDRDREEGTVASGGKKTAGAVSSGGRENMLAYWTPEVANQPARVTLLSFPSRTVLRQKNLFNVSDVSTTFPTFGAKMTSLGTFFFFFSANYIGKIKVTFCASRSIDTPRQKRRRFVTWRYLG